MRMSSNLGTAALVDANGHRLTAGAALLALRCVVLDRKGAAMSSQASVQLTFETSGKNAKGVSHIPTWVFERNIVFKSCLSSNSHSQSIPSDSGNFTFLPVFTKLRFPWSIAKDANPSLVGAFPFATL